MNISDRNWKQTIWFWKGFLWCSSEFHPGTTSVFDLCWWYASSSKIKFALVCWWLRRAKNICKLNLSYKEINIKQQAQVRYLGCVLDESMSGEPMALKVVDKINGKLKFLFRKNIFSTPELRRMLCNVLIQSHFDYACTV